jgi:uncharacterized DUF497 family protein
VIFAYDDWNREHVQKHSVSCADAEYVVENARPPYPKKIEEGKFMVYGPSRAGEILEVVFAFKTDAEIEFEALEFSDWGEWSDSANPVAVYIIHAMPITGRKKRQYRRRMR